MFSYRVTINRLTTRAVLAQQQKVALNEPGVERPMLDTLCNERETVTRVFVSPDQHLATLQEMVEQELGSFDIWDSHWVVIEVLGWAVVWGENTVEADGGTKPPSAQG